jgi:hypothetical protein
MLKRGRGIRLLALTATMAVFAAAQSALAQAAEPPAAMPVTVTAPSVAPARAFRGIDLGMDRDSAIAALKKDPIFAYRGPEDLSLLPSPNQSLIEVAGLSFVRRGYFQFFEGKLWVMILELDADKVDHYSVYTSLVAKYGEPGLLDPKESRWEDTTTRMALERPLTLRYMDMTVYGKLREGSGAKASVQALDRQGFLGGL